MTTDPRIEAAAKAINDAMLGHQPHEAWGDLSTAAVDAADLVDPLRNPIDRDIERAAKTLHDLNNPTERWLDQNDGIRESFRQDVRAVVAALRGGSA